MVSNYENIIMDLRNTSANHRIYSILYLDLIGIKIKKMMFGGMGKLCIMKNCVL